MRLHPKFSAMGRYTRGVKRLLQLGTLMLLLTTLLMPLIEFFDQWDPPGPSNDTEMAVFGFIFALCLVIIVCRLTAALAAAVNLILIPGSWRSRRSPSCDVRIFPAGLLPLTSPPLQI